MPASAALSACRPTSSLPPIWSSVCALRVPATPRSESTAITSRTRTSAMPSRLRARRALTLVARWFIGSLSDSVSVRQHDLRAQGAGQILMRQRVHLGRARRERDVVLVRVHRQHLEVRDTLDGGLCPGPLVVVAE